MLREQECSKAFTVDRLGHFVYDSYTNPVRCLQRRALFLVAL